jgi:hypothetical protein
MSDICHVYQREIRAPIEIGLRVEMTDAGLIDRAMLLISDVVQGLNNRGDLIADALTALPAGDDFAVERSILTALADLQTDVLTKHIRGRAA